MTCYAPNCETPARTSGLCNKHYLRLRNKGSLDAPVKIKAYPPDATCSVCGNAPVAARGFCEMHYSRWKRHGDPEKIAPSGQPRKHPEMCPVEGCEKPTRLGNGYCSAHEQRRRKYGDPLGVAPPRALDPNPSYAAMHFRVIKARGHASQYACVDCGGPAKDWSFDHIGEVYLSPTGMPYGYDVDAFSPRCRICHKVFDLKHL